MINLAFVYICLFVSNEIKIFEWYSQKSSLASLKQFVVSIDSSVGEDAISKTKSFFIMCRFDFYHYVCFCFVISNVIICTGLFKKCVKGSQNAIIKVAVIQLTCHHNMFMRLFMPILIFNTAG